MSSSSDQPQGPPGSAQLNGWKDIAAYLGRSVRTVQRWEKDYGLPVRRFGLSRPESVFALAREIDEWLLTSQGVSARSGAGEPAGGPSEIGKPVAAEADSHRRSPFDSTSLGRMGMTALVTAGVMAALWALWSLRQPAQPAGRPTVPVTKAAPADWHVDLDTLVVSDHDGETLWTHTFSRDLASDSYKGTSGSARSLLGGVADVDGDGLREVWLVAYFSGGWSPANTALYLFEHDGRLRWMYQPSLHVTFGKEAFGPSWFVNRVFVTADPGGGAARAIWAVMYDAALFPSLLQRLDSRTGKPLSAFWSNGYIITLALDLKDDRRRLFLGTCNNEHKAGSLVVLDAMHPNGSAPAALEKYRCTSCPPGEPLAFLVFPKAARFGQSEETGGVERITPLADGGVTVGVQHGTAAGLNPAVAIYTLDAAFNPRSVDTADNFMQVYVALVAQGRAPAGAPSVINPDREFLPILRWDSAARRYVQVPKAAASR